MLATVLEWLTDFLTVAIMESRKTARSKTVASPPWCCLILSKNNIFSRKPLLQYKGGGCYLIGSFIYPCFLCHIIKLRLFRLIFKGNLHYSMQLKANGVHALANQMKLVEKKTNVLSKFIVRFQWHENNSIFSVCKQCFRTWRNTRNRAEA